MKKSKFQKNFNAICIMMFFLLIMLFMNGKNVQAASSKKAYKAYYNWLVKDVPSKYKAFCLVKLDGDNTMELVGHYKRKEYWDSRIKDYNISEDCYIICSYNGKDVVVEEFGEGKVNRCYSELSYIPNKGKIRKSTFPSGAGVSWDEIVTLKKGKFKETASGTINCSGNYSEWDYIWNNKSVTEKKYKKLLKKAFDNSKAKSFSDLKFISKKKMKKKLK